MTYRISAFYRMPNGQVMERMLRKKGEIAHYSDQSEAESAAARMLELLPKAYEVAVFQEGGQRVKAFTRTIAPI